jgi:hypothetical protein
MPVRAATDLASNLLAHGAQAKNMPLDEGAFSMTLEEIGRKHGTDKTSQVHDYLRQYERIFLPLVPSVRLLIEIGVLNGSSIRTWKEFFPHATIIGVDIQERCLEYAEDRIQIEIGRQEDPAFLSYLKSRYQPNIIIDDGSHIWEHQIATFEALYPTIRPGGMYVVEDLHTSRVQRYGTPDMRVAAEYFGDLVAHIAADGVPMRQKDSAIAKLVRAETETVTVGRRFIVFKKKA